MLDPDPDWSPSGSITLLYTDHCQDRIRRGIIFPNYTKLIEFYIEESTRGGLLLPVPVPYFYSQVTTCPMENFVIWNVKVPCMQLHCPVEGRRSTPSWKLSPLCRDIAVVLLHTRSTRSCAHRRWSTANSKQRKYMLLTYVSRQNWYNERVPAKSYSIRFQFTVWTFLHDSTAPVFVLEICFETEVSFTAEWEFTFIYSL
jgi:hypothetical protein